MTSIEAVAYYVNNISSLYILESTYGEDAHQPYLAGKLEEVRANGWLRWFLSLDDDNRRTFESLVETYRRQQQQFIDARGVHTGDKP